MRKRLSLALILALFLALAAWASSLSAGCPYDEDCLDNPYGAGSPYKSDGLMNPYSDYGSPYSDKSWTNPYAENAPKIYDQDGNYRGLFSSNVNDPESVSNPNGQYGSPYSPDSINSPYGVEEGLNGEKRLYIVHQERNITTIIEKEK